MSSRDDAPPARTGEELAPPCTTRVWTPEVGRVTKTRLLPFSSSLRIGVKAGGGGAPSDDLLTFRYIGRSSLLHIFVFVFSQNRVFSFDLNQVIQSMSTCWQCFHAGFFFFVACFTNFIGYILVLVINYSYFPPAVRVGVKIESLRHRCDSTEGNCAKPNSDAT